MLFPLYPVSLNFRGGAMSIMWVGNLDYTTIRCVYNEPERNMVIAGTLRTDNEMYLRAKNLLVLGELSAARVSIVVKEGFYNLGKISGNATIQAGTCYGRITDAEVLTLRQLGFDITKDPSGSISLRQPEKIEDSPSVEQKK